ncbi:hypothetical protein [Nocardia grenadensis]|uniref:hypothetical protein n=1 Tax=Nocardia grenadensis TaxID=931537 RepID=UPI000ADBAA2A|nr:hypothetical protein [Nocardia grenadensis]
MSNKHTPWSRSRHRAGLSADQFGSLDPGVIRAARSRAHRNRPAATGSLDSVRLLGTAAHDSGLAADMRAEDAESDSEDDLAECPPGRGPGPAPSASPSALGRPECDPKRDRSTDLLAEQAPAERRPTESAVDDGGRRWTVPDPPVPHPARIPAGPAATARVPHHAGPPPETVNPVWTGPDAEALELLPVGGHALLGLCLGMAVLLAVGFFYLGRTTDSDSAAAPTAAIAASTMTPRETAAPAAESPDIGAGFVWGKVLTNDGSTLTVKSEISHSEVVVHTDDHTKIYVLIATTIEAIAEGAPIMVYGRKHADGSIFADTITGVSLRALGTH